MRVVIFDMDGTLLDSKKDITLSVNYVRKIHHTLPPLSEDFIVEAINMHNRNLSKLFYETDVYTQRDKELFEVHYHEQCIKNVYLYSGISNMLKHLRRADVKISVATNAPTQFALRMLEHLDVKHLFDIIVGADMVEESKPNPQMLNMILEYYGFDKNLHRAWMVGDNTKDVLSAERAGIKPIFATWGFSADAPIPAVAKKPSDILDIVL
jgi:phosphoglycolate phosphatase